MNKYVEGSSGVCKVCMAPNNTGKEPLCLECMRVLSEVYEERKKLSEKLPK